MILSLVLGFRSCVECDECYLSLLSLQTFLGDSLVNAMQTLDPLGRNPLWSDLIKSSDLNPNQRNHFVWINGARSCGCESCGTWCLLLLSSWPIFVFMSCCTVWISDCISSLVAMSWFSSLLMRGSHLQPFSGACQIIHQNGHNWWHVNLWE